MFGTDLLFVRSQPYVGLAFYTYGLLGYAPYDVPPGSTEGVDSDTLRSQLGNPDGTVWVGVKTAAGAVKIKNIDVRNGTLIAEITLAGMTQMNDGYSMILLPNSQFLVSGIVGGVRVLVRYDGTNGTALQTYSLPADRVENIGLASDGKTVYYSGHVGDTTMYRWDISTDTGAANFGTLTNWDRMFVMMPDDRVLGVFSSGGGPVAKMINTDASVQMVYVPSDPATSSSVIGGVAYDIARERIYFSCCHTGGGGFMGILMAFDVKNGSTPLWSVPIATVTSNVVGKLCMCPPLGSPQAYNPTSTVTERIRCMRVCPILSHENVRTVFDELWIDAETGQAVVGDGDMTFWVSISRDSGHTFGPEFAIPASRQGQYQWRIIRRRLGQARNMVFKVWTDSPAGQAWLQAILRIRPGTS